MRQPGCLFSQSRLIPTSPRWLTESSGIFSDEFPWMVFLRIACLLIGASLLQVLLRQFFKNDTSNQQQQRFSTDELHQFLPTFLSQGSQDAFIDEIKYFLASQQAKPFYSFALTEKSILFQGDGLSGLSIINLPDPTIRPGSAVLLSNTCDMDPSNRRLFDSSLTY